MKRVYLDYCASTPVSNEVLDAMAPFWSQDFANTGGIHSEALAAAAAVDAARAASAQFLHARKPRDIIFTSGATEANNLGFFGPIEALLQKGRSYEDLHIITTPIEHKSVLEPARALEAKGVKLTLLSVNEEGQIDTNELREALTPNTVLVSIAYVNSEIGTIQPIHECVRIIDAYRRETGAQYPYFHTDATQAPLYLDCNVESLGVDMMSLGGQKIYGPKGIGLLYVRDNVDIAPMMFGGTREEGLRPGTHPTPLIVGFAKALEEALAKREHEEPRVQVLRDQFISRVLEAFPDAKLNGPRENRVAHNANISFIGCDNEYIVLALDTKGIACSAKSACSKGGSHVLEGLNKGDEYTKSAVRFSFGKDTTEEDIDTVQRVLETSVRRVEVTL